MTRYLDYNASAPLRKEAAAAMAASMAHCGNPSSVHAAGRTARRRVEEAREAVAGLVGAAAERVIFTSGATEADNLALRGVSADRVLVSAIEHDAVRAARDDSETVPVTDAGRLDLAALQTMLSAMPPGKPPGGRTLVSLMAANNETGIIQPLAETAAMARAAGAMLHCDAAQAVGRMTVDMARDGIDLLSLSGHKLGAPMGVGALVLGETFAGDAELRPMLRGGGQERRRRAGTENVPAIAGLGAVARLLQTGWQAEAARQQELMRALENRLAAVAPAAVVIGRDSPRLPNTLCLALPGIDAALQVMALDLDGIAVSAGAACSSGVVRPGHVLRAMGLAPAIADAAIRVSIGWATGMADIDGFCRAYAKLAARTDTMPTMPVRGDMMAAAGA